MTGQRDNGRAKGRISQRRAARILGVTQEHLNRVLRGHRKSERLLAHYSELMTLQGRETQAGRPNEQTKKEERQT
jgi:transcriptional regulator with XRE-family HTH domain